MRHFNPKTENIIICFYNAKIQNNLEQGGLWK
nr:MAG TPA: hypothetical protein [Caudoviricetes sp.]